MSVVPYPSTTTCLPIGPAPTATPPVSLGFSAGRVEAAEPDPTNANVMYVAGDNGGVWKTGDRNTTDGPPTWISLNDDKPSLDFASYHPLVVHPATAMRARTTPALAASILAALAFAPAVLLAQTPAAEVKDAANVSLMQVNTDAGFVVRGAFGVGTIPATGAGTRLMWHPAKAAFRAGHVPGAGWDDANVGLYSVAFGSETRASGDYAAATGSRTIASGEYSTALGNRTNAGGASSTAIGSSTDALGDRSTAMGASTTASGDASTAMGNSTTASGNNATAMGLGTSAQAYASVALGRYNTLGLLGSVSGTTWQSDDPLLVAGNGTSAAFSDRSNALLLRKDAGFVVGGTYGVGTLPASGAGVRLVWYPGKGAFRAGRVDGAQWSEANVGDGSAATGYNTTASGSVSTAVGYATTASGIIATAMGSQTTASGSASTAMGSATTASGNISTAMGFGTTAQASTSVTIGRYNVASGDMDTWVANDPLLVGGDGAHDGARSNSFVIFKNGSAQFQGTVTASVASPSDARLKEDVAPLADVLGKVLRLRPVTYRYRAETERSRALQVGLVAQEVQRLFPELVETAPDGYLSVAYGNLAPVAVATIQEQQAGITALRAENAALRDRLAALEAKVAALRAELDGRLAALEAAWARPQAPPTPAAAPPSGRPR